MVTSKVQAVLATSYKTRDYESNKGYFEPALPIFVAIIFFFGDLTDAAS